MKSRQFFVDQGLESFVDESIKRTRNKGRTPVRFMSIREQLGSKKAIEFLVESDDEQSGFVWAVENGLKDWTLEQAVLEFRDHFSSKTQAFAKARLERLFQKQ